MTDRFRTAHNAGRRAALTAMPALLIAQAASAGELTKVAIISGAQQTPPVATTATGCARVVIDTLANTMTYHVSFGGLSSPESTSHIHAAAEPGASGPVLHVMPLGNPKVGVWNYPQSLESEILDGKSYINIHSGNFPGGEIRGQIVDRVALIDQTQEVQPSGSKGLGFGLFNMNTASNELRYYIAFDALTGNEIGSHLHGYGLHGVDANVQHVLPTGSPKIGVFEYPEEDEDRILAGQLYVNIHTTKFQPGEIRGQIVGIVAPLDGDQQTPPVITLGHGCMFCAVDDTLDFLSYYVSHANLSGPATAAHIHGYAGPGGGGGVEHGIGTSNPAIGAWNYPAAREADVFAGQTYVNVHTAAHPGGEVRGQILFPLEACVADIDCSGAVDFQDILAVLSAWGNVGAPEDIDGSGFVDFGDLLLILGNWGVCP